MLVDSSNNILGKYFNFREYFGGSTYDIRLCDFPCAAPRFCEEFQELYFGTNTRDRVSGYDCKFKNNDSVFTFRNGEENEESLSGSVQNAKYIPVKFDKIVRNINFHYSSSPPSTSLVLISATTTNFNIEK